MQCCYAAKLQVLHVFRPIGYRWTGAFDAFVGHAAVPLIAELRVHAAA